MNRYPKFYRLIILSFILATFIPSSRVSVSARASVAGSQMVTENGHALSPRETDELKIKRVLENKLVKEKLLDSGMSEKEVIQKIENMSDNEIHQIASLSEKVPSGGSAVGFVVGLLAITVLVLVIIYLAKRV